MVRVLATVIKGPGFQIGCTQDFSKTLCVQGTITRIFSELEKMKTTRKGVIPPLLNFCLYTLAPYNSHLFTHPSAKR